MTALVTATCPDIAALADLAVLSLSSPHSRRAYSSAIRAFLDSGEPLTRDGVQRHVLGPTAGSLIMDNESMTMNCEVCAQPFTTTNPRQKFCAKKCRNVFHNVIEFQDKSLKAMGVVAPGTVGAIGELMVAADLLSRGYAVFRALSPSCASDLVITEGQHLITIEVRTARKSSRTGKLWSSEKNLRSDVIAYVVHTQTGQEITYQVRNSLCPIQQLRKARIE